MTILIPNDHRIILSSQEITAICQPLMSVTDIHYFYYTRYFQDGTFFCLNTNPQWVQYFYNNHHYPNEAYVKALPTDCHELFSSYDSALASEAAQTFNLNNFFSFYEQKAEYSDIYGYAMSSKSQYNLNFYFNHIGLLKMFSLFFREKAATFFAYFDDTKNRIYLPNYKVVSPGPPSLLLSSQLDKAKALYLKILPDKFTVHYQNKTTYLTKRELQCVGYGAVGNTIKETAKLLNLSPRTVESHLNNAKERLNCYTTSELVAIYLNSGLADVMTVLKDL